MSGLGAWTALAYLAAAADQPSGHDLHEAVGAEGADAARAVEHVLGALKASPATAGAASLWLAPDVEITEWWQEVVGSHGVRRLVGDARTDDEAINAWVSEATRGLIHQSPAQVDESTRLMLLSAIAVITSWSEPFNGSLLMPLEGPWCGRRVQSLARTSTDRDALAVAGEGADAVTVVRVEGDGQVDVYLGLGHADRAAKDVLTSTIEVAIGVTTTRRGASLLRRPRGGPGVLIGIPNPGPEPVLRIELPRFSAEGNHDLLEHAEVFGLTSVTDPHHGHFGRLANEPLAIDRANQAARAEFTELGFRAAAVTAMAMMAGGVPEPDPESLVVTFDRPFGFVATRRDLGLALTAGWVAEVEDWKASIHVG